MMAQKELSFSECKSYLSRVKDLEMQCYQLERLYGNLSQYRNRANNEIQNLHNAKETPPQKPSIISEIWDFFFDMGFQEIAGCIIGGGIIVYTIAFFICGCIAVAGGKPDLKETAIWVTGVAIGILLLCFIASFINECKEYPKEMHLFQKREQTRQDSIERNKKLAVRMDKELGVCRSEYQKTKKLLNRFYEENIIYPKYRSMVAVYTIYEYFDSGICVTLTGHEGAYNLYEQELRFNRIMGKLDDIIERLDSINDTQILLVQELRDSNSKIDKLSGSLRKIERNTDATQYYAGITANNTEYLAWLYSIETIRR